jgi:manganese transport protein
MKQLPHINKDALKAYLRFLGPGFLITVGFVDPGNWATNIEGGSRFGYDLLWVITVSTVMLIVIQNMSARLGIATGASLAANVRTHFPAPVSGLIGVTVVLACVATDAAEVLGGAIGFHLLFGVPLWLGALVTVMLEIFFVVGQQYHRLEKIIVGFLGVIALCYVAELAIVGPDWSRAAVSAFVPTIDSKSIYTAMAILGAVVMPHNIFLHSNVIQSRKWGEGLTEKASMLKFEKFDTFMAMSLGWIVNSSMIIVAAAVFFQHGILVSSIEQASATLRPLAGPLAATLFAAALVCSGVASSITSSMAEVNVITGFLGKPEDPRTLLYRIGVFATAVPSLIIIALGLDPFRILILSQVVLSIQLPFTLIPLLLLCRRKDVMGDLRSGRGELAAAILIAAAVIALNLYLLYTTVTKGI